MKAQEVSQLNGETVRKGRVIPVLRSVDVLESHPITNQVH